ncbi:MAG TPA: hypothetical protein VD978_37095 [Azospirillum sp.]|nr:hypothetical protein [Azospirillum sp.]
MNRVRWLNAEWPIPIRLLTKKIQGMSFAEGSYDGFVLDKARDDYFEARYIERVDLKEVVVDPFGNEHSFERLEFRQIAFRASMFFPGVELVDSHRNISKMLNRLSEAADFGVAITPISVSALAWAENLQEELSADSIIDSMQIGSIKIETGILVKAIISGDRDVRSAGEYISQGRGFTLEKLRVRLRAPFDGTIVLSNRGAATVVTESGAEELIAILRSSLAKAVSKPDGQVVPFSGN